MHFKSTSKISLIDKVQGKICPLDYCTKPMKVLYNKVTKKSSCVIYFDGKDPIKLLEGRAIVGSIMEGDLIGIAVVKGKSMEIYLGEQKNKLKKIMTLKKPIAIGFTKNGKRIIFKDSNKILCYKIIK